MNSPARLIDVISTGGVSLWPSWGCLWIILTTSILSTTRHKVANPCPSGFLRLSKFSSGWSPMQMKRLRFGIILVSAGLVDALLIHITTGMDRSSPWPWVLSLLLPILLLAGCLLIGKGMGERKEVVYDFRHGRAPDSERNVR